MSDIPQWPFPTGKQPAPPENGDKVKGDAVDAITLLRESAALFRQYEASHRAKYRKLRAEDDDRAPDSWAKAEVNMEMAMKIEKFLGTR